LLTKQDHNSYGQSILVVTVARNSGNTPKTRMRGAPLSYRNGRSMHVLGFGEVGGIKSRFAETTHVKRRMKQKDRHQYKSVKFGAENSQIGEGIKEE